MTVIHPNSISGITSVTSHSNSLYFYESDHSTKLTINAHVNGNVTSTNATFSGDVNIGGTLTYEDVTNIDSVGIITARSGIHVTGGSVGIGTDAPGTLLELKGESSKEATVTFNRSPVQGTNDGIIGEFLFENNTDSVALLAVKRESAADDAYIQFATQSTGGGLTERLRITSAGNLGVGNDGNFPIYTGTNDRTLFLGTGSEDSAIQIHSGTSNYGGLYFGDATTGSNRYRGYIEFKHGTSDDFLRFGTAATERLRINLNGSIQITPEGSTSNPYMLIDTSGDSVRFSAQKASGNNEFRFLTQSSGTVAERLRIGSTGRISIGNATNNANPTALLGVIADDGEAADLYVGKFHNLEATAGQCYGVDIRAGSNSTDHGFRVKNRDNDTTQFIVRGDGNIGIGENNPDRQLSVYHNSNSGVEIKSSTTGQSSVFFTDTADGNIGMIGYMHNDDSMFFRVNDQTRVNITSDGYVTKPNTPYFSVQASPSLSNFSGYDNSVHSFSTINSNNGSHYNNSTGRFTAPVAGFYWFSGGIWSSNSSASTGTHYLVLLRQNSNAGGAVEFAGCNHVTYRNQLTLSAGIYLTVGQTVRLWYNGSIQGSSPRNYFSGYLVG